MELYHKKIPVQSRTWTLMPFGDLQKGDPGFREDIWLTWKREMLENPTAYALGLGDYSNTFRPTIRKKIGAVMQEDPEAMDELTAMVKNEMDKLAEELHPLRKRLIGLLEGHHYTLLSGCTSTQYLCEILGVKYLGFVCFLNIAFAGEHLIQIFATHGCGGAKFTSTDMGNLERTIMPFWDADIFLRGHSTKLCAMAGAPLNYVVNIKGKMCVCEKQRLLVNCGGFMSGYTEGKSGYVELKNLPPSALGYPTIDIHLRARHGDSGKTMEIIPRFYSPGRSEER